MTNNLKSLNLDNVFFYLKNNIILVKEIKKKQSCYITNLLNSANYLKMFQ